MSHDRPTTSQSSNDKHSPRQQRNLSKEEEDDYTMDTLRMFFSQRLNLSEFLVDTNETFENKVLQEPTFEAFCEHWRTKGFKNIITMVGAGISTSAGIPDFRSPGSGLYDNLEKYNLPRPSAIFEMDYFRDTPQPFFTLAKELYPGSFDPTLAHYFIRLLYEKGLLVRHYTQNIDTLDRLAGIPDDKLVECHGTFYTNHCLGCEKLYSMEWMKEQIFADNTPTCPSCNEIVKPDIVFFGENLPDKFYSLSAIDFGKCDLLIIMGTSLEVQPFASLVDRVGPQCVRLLINRTKVGSDIGVLNHYFFGGHGLKFDHPDNTRDVAYTGDCDVGVKELAEALGWSKELDELVQRERTRLAKENEKLKALRNEGTDETEKDTNQLENKVKDEKI